MGRDLAVTQNEKERIWELVFGEGMTVTAAAEAIGRTRETVSRHVNSDEGKVAEKKIYEALGRAARGRLSRAASRAADSWVKQLDLADSGEKSNHAPARDLLTHIGAVDIAVPNTAKGTQIIIQIGKGSIDDIEPEVIDIVPERRLEAHASDPDLPS